MSEFSQFCMICHGSDWIDLIEPEEDEDNSTKHVTTCN